MPMSPSERLRNLHVIAQDLDRLNHHIMELRARELRGWLMIEAAINEAKRRDEQDAKDDEEVEWGNASRDGMK